MQNHSFYDTGKSYHLNLCKLTGPDEYHNNSLNLFSPEDKYLHEQNGHQRRVQYSYRGGGYP